jgi:carboxyl-terminal processing protease
VCAFAARAAAQTGAVTASRPTVPAVGATSDALREFDTAWRILRDNYVAENAAHIDWDALRAELRPRAEAAQSIDDVRALIRVMLARVGQSHFAILPAPIASDLGGPALSPGEVGSAGFDVIPLDGNLVVERVDDGGPAAEAGVAPGWVLTRVGDRDVQAALLATSAESSGGPSFRRWALGTSMLRGRVGAAVDLEFRDGSEVLVRKQVVRRPEPGTPVKFGHLPTLFARVDARPVARNGRQIGVIAFNVWMTPIAQQLDDAIDRFRQAKGLVIDLRGNPGGVLTMIMGFAGHFLDAPVNLGTITTRESSLSLVANPRVVNAAGKRVKPFAGPVAILIDGGSYSASEIFAGGMQSVSRARVFGSQTAGGALPAVLERLPGGDVLQYAIGDFTTSRGDRIEGRGVVPDVSVSPTRQKLLEGRDPALEAALDWIEKGPETR